ncbi:MAG: secretin N-terminal domain-containing protein, partial [Planctomycetota bacterium]
GTAVQLALQNRREGGGGGLAGLGGGGTFSNLADRMTVDPQSNALIFRGTPGEIERVRGILALIDVPNKLQPKSYFAGSAAAQIADIASRSGFGQVIQVENTSNTAGGNLNQVLRAQQNQLGSAVGGNSDASIGGPVMVVDVNNGRIIYYGTDQQQQQLATLMEELRTEDERVVLRTYVLNHSDAVTVADLINAIITGEQQTGDSPLLPTQSGNRGQTNTRAAQALRGFGAEGAGDDVSGVFDPDIVTVTAAEETNMVIVNAPIRQQEELEKLITILDRRRAQVYIEAQIVSVSDDEEFTLAFESQFLSGDFGVNTNFGLGSFGTGGSFTDVKQVNTGLSGLTSAVIRSDYLPLIINATQTNGDVRILSTPQLLVNDNEESEIVSLSEEPFSEITQADGADNLVGFGGFEEAGTTLRVTPSISDGGFLRLEYYVELSNFTDTSGTDGNPPPRDRNTIEGAVTVPSDSTIVIGGISVDNSRDTVIKIPFIGDIPLVGELFKRTDKIENKSKLYVFITPRIMTDSNFNDLKLLTSGPQADMSIDGVTPPLEPVRIRSIAPGAPVFPSDADPSADPGAPELGPESIRSGE